MLGLSHYVTLASVLTWTTQAAGAGWQQNSRQSALAAMMCHGLSKQAAYSKCCKEVLSFRMTPSGGLHDKRGEDISSRAGRRLGIGCKGGSRLTGSH